LAYLAIARKYRPNSFEEMVGQNHVTATLRNAILRQRIHHAYLFCGARGVGKTTAARAFARALSCAQGPTPEPCGECPSCKAILAGSSPDLTEIDGASNNSVDDVRELRESVRYPPSIGRYRIYLIDEVHMLSNAAFNALLKTLEEPPPHVVFLFATTEADKLPDTILSRVQRFDFRRMPIRVVVDRLRSIAAAEGAVVSEAGLRMIARAGEGSMRDAQSLLDKVISFGGAEISDDAVSETLGLVDRSLLIGLFEGLLRGDLVRCLDVVATVHDWGHDPARLVAELLEMVRDAAFITLSEGARKHVDLPEEERDALAKLTEGVPSEVLVRLFHALLDTHEAVVRAPRPRAVLELALVRMADPRPVQPVAALVARLEQMERRARQSSGAGSTTPREPPRRNAGPIGRANRAPSPATGTPLAGSPPAPLSSPSEPPLNRWRTSGGGPAAPESEPTLPAAATDADRWAAFVRAVSRANPPVSALDGATGRREDQVLVVTVASSRKLAEAKRAAERPDVQRALQTCYGAQAKLRLEASLASRRPGIDPELERLVVADPAVQAILRHLDATLLDITPDHPPTGPLPGDAP
jgi:DNA polymerase-3 subunit gamma/tau